MLRDVDFERSIENKNCKHGLNSMDLQQLTLDFQNYVVSIIQTDSIIVFVTVRVPKFLPARRSFAIAPVSASASRSGVTTKSDPRRILARGSNFYGDN